MLKEHNFFSGDANGLADAGKQQLANSQQTADMASRDLPALGQLGDSIGVLIEAIGASSRAFRRNRAHELSLDLDKQLAFAAKD